MKRSLSLIIAILIIQLAIGPAVWGATYYVTQSGTGAKDGSLAAPSAIATFNAGTAPYDDLAGDTVCFMDAITTTLTPAVSGSGTGAGMITLQGNCVAGREATITSTSNQDVYIASKDYITVMGFNLRGGTNRNVYATGAGITLDSLNCSGSPVAIYSLNSSSLTLQNMPSLSVSGNGRVIWTTGAADGTGLVISNVTTTGGGQTDGTGAVDIDFFADATITGLTINSPTGYGLKYKAQANGNSLVLTNYTSATTGNRSAIYYNGNSKTGLILQIISPVIDSKSGGMEIISGTFDATSYIRNPVITCAANNAGYQSGIYFSACNALPVTGGAISNQYSDGVYSNNSPDISVIGMTINNNGRDGISFNGTSTGGIAKRNIVYNNGQIDATGNGDGITAHTGCTGLLFDNNLIYGNKGSGMSFVGDSSGSAINNTFKYNGDGATTNMGKRGGFYSTSTGAWVLKNNIFEGNFPAEVKTDSVAHMQAITFGGNLYYHAGNSVTLENFAAVADDGATYITYAAFKAAYDTGAVYGDPQFLSATDYRLRANSPARRMGDKTALSGVANVTDIRGRVVTDAAGTVKVPYLDAGAYQSVESLSRIGGRNMLWYAP